MLPKQSIKNLKPLDDMVSEVDFLSLFPGSVFNIENADEVSSPTTQEPIEELKQDP